MLGEQFIRPLDRVFVHMLFQNSNEFDYGSEYKSVSKV